MLLGFLVIMTTHCAVGVNRGQTIAFHLRGPFMSGMLSSIYTSEGRKWGHTYVHCLVIRCGQTGAPSPNTHTPQTHQPWKSNRNHLHIYIFIYCDHLCRSRAGTRSRELLNVNRRKSEPLHYESPSWCRTGSCSRTRGISPSTGSTGKTHLKE